MASEQENYDSHSPKYDKVLLLPDSADNTGLPTDTAQYTINGELPGDHDSKDVRPSGAILIFGSYKLSSVLSVMLLTSVNLLNYMDRFTVAGLYV